MSVYTNISGAELERFLERYRCGALVAFEGIGEGIENTNYFVDTRRGSYVLTIFEWLAHDELPYFLELMAHLADAGLPCPHPVADARGDCLQRLKDKPATLITRLRGRTVAAADAGHCEQVGGALARLHEAARTFRRRRPNGRDLDWFNEQQRRLAPRLSDDERALLRSEIAHQAQAARAWKALPHGTIHADLFRDNVLFDGDRLSGLIDFYYACEGCLLYDVAVAVNDWCRRDDGGVHRERYVALLRGYRERRAPTPAEARAWPDVLRRAALRFWLSRLRDRAAPRDGAITHVKDPEVFRNILLDCRAGAPALAAAT